MAGRVTLNPFSTRHPVLPPPIVLLAKVIAIAVLVKGPGSQTTSGVAFFEFLERIPPETYGSIALRLIQIGGVLIVFNVATRTGAFIMGFSMFALNLGNMATFAHSALLTSLLLLLTALWTPQFGSRALQLQMALLYWGAALNKLADPDWWTGAYLQAYLRPGAWASPPYAQALIDVGLFDLFALAASLGTMALEAAAGIAFLRRETAGRGVGLSAALHVGILTTIGFDYGIFLYAVLASYLACVDWPATLKVTPPERGIGRLVLRGLERIDADRILRLSGGPGDTGDHRLGADDRRGANAWAYLVLRFPPALLALHVLLVWPDRSDGAAWTRSFIVAGLAALAFAHLAYESRRQQPRARASFQHS